MPATKARAITRRTTPAKSTTKRAKKVTRGTTFHARTATEFVLKVPNRTGELARILQKLSTSGINVLGFFGYTHDADAFIHIVTDSAGKTRTALAGTDWTFEEKTVVTVQSPSGRGQGAKLTRFVADAGVNLEYAYATTTGRGHGLAILKGRDPETIRQALTQ